MKAVNYKLLIIKSLLVLFFISCNKNETDMIEPIVVQETSSELKSSYNLLNISPNVYHDYFKEANHSAGFSSLKSNSLSEHSIVQRMKINDTDEEKSFSINGKNINSFSKATKVSKIEGGSVYGKTLRFRIKTAALSAKNGDSSSETDVEMYVPD